MADWMGGLLGSPTTQFALGLLANNQAPRLAGRGAAFNNALQGGLLGYQRGQALQGQQALYAAQQAELQRRAQETLALQSLLASLPPEERMLAQMDPKAWVQSKQPHAPPAAAQMAEYYRANPWALEQELAIRKSGATSISIPPNIKEGYEYGTDEKGQPFARPVPGGPHDPLAPKAPTETQRKAGGFLQRMEAASPVLDEMNAPSYIDYTAATTGGLANLIASPKTQSEISAAREWISGMLRYESGAAVPDTEFARYFSTYFPVPGDDESVVAQKKAARRRAEDSIRTGAGPVAGGSLPPPPPGFEVIR